jgi:hypothetical protein
MSEGFPQDDFQFPVRVEGDESAIPAEYRPLYRKDPQDGSLSIIPALAERFEAPAKLQSALRMERNNTKEVEKREKARLKQVLEVIGANSPDEVPHRLEELKKGISSQVDQTRAEIEARYQATFGAQARAAREEAERLRKAFTEQLVESQVTSAIAAAKGNARLLAPHVKAAMGIREEGGQFVPRVLDKNGDVRYRDDGLPMAPADLVAELKRDPDYLMAFEGSGNSGSGAISRGSGAGAGGATPGAKTFTKAEWRDTLARERDPEKRAAMMRDYSKGRITIKD